MSAPLIVFAEPWPWVEQAECRGMDPALFYPGHGVNLRYDEAPKVCAVCLVRTECAEAGMDEIYGVWGGLGENDRRRLRNGRVLIRGVEQRRPARPEPEHGTVSRYRMTDDPCRCDMCRQAHADATRERRHAAAENVHEGPRLVSGHVVPGRGGSALVDPGTQREEQAS
jgi:WhiB family redox-sensing transcriptional regulator